MMAAATFWPEKAAPPWCVKKGLDLCLVDDRSAPAAEPEQAGPQTPPQGEAGPPASSPWFRYYPPPFPSPPAAPGVSSMPHQPVPLRAPSSPGTGGSAFTAYPQKSAAQLSPQQQHQFNLWWWYMYSMSMSTAGMPPLYTPGLPAHPRQSPTDQGARPSLGESLDQALLCREKVEGASLSRKRSQDDRDGLGASRKNRRQAPEVRVCSNCHTSNSPFWRKDKDKGSSLCNACGLYFAKNDSPRPQTLWKKG